MKKTGHGEKNGGKRRLRVLLPALAVLAAAALVWGMAVEPLLFTVTEITHEDARLPKELDGLRVVFITDLHAGEGYSPQNVERLVKKVQSLNPDMVLFGGDLLENEITAKKLDAERVSVAFSALSPRYGKYAVYGNHDLWTPATKEIAGDILERGGFTVLENSAEEVAPGFCVAGTLPWPMPRNAGQGKLSDAGKVAWTAEDDSYSLLLAHEPAQIHESAAHPFALQLSGHTHGGQVALPLMGPILLPDGTEVYKFGWYEHEGVKMYVSRGIGTSILRIRLFVPPEIVVLTLRAAGD